ncbi:multidrug ABC transporter ATP-binding protein [Paenibacillus sp. CAA11]|uniref:ABC transporter ATP-binding protein n=1 Tax=Paenibacillus sp. CAA11 TaxID=1532905 RepID=UPI000D34869C|nr:ATP-binding cassette domain-containing protein [Paenibacillus sp. CAA11]AWB43699.1 multidrug ABC transporter ATP-binding protein [Paenibacillus sp. CAA11]
MIRSIIQVEQVRRTYLTEQGMWRKKKQTVEALKGISFEVGQGEIFGLLGPNGAGKTTMIKILTTMLIPTDGHVNILGLNPVTEFRALRPQINFILGGERNLYWRLSAYDNLTYFADLYKVPKGQQKDKIQALLELVGLEASAHRRVETFSKGMKQRLQIARGLINEPQILFLDEPSIGLDPISARKLRQIIHQLNEQGTTILLTTHYMQEADELCDRIAFINQGEIAAIDTPEQLKKKIGQLSVIQFSHAHTSGISAASSALGIHPAVHHLEETHDEYSTTLRIHTPDPQQIIPLIYKEWSQSDVHNLSINEPSLEDVYLRLIGGDRDASRMAGTVANR